MKEIEESTSSGTERPDVAYARQLIRKNFRWTRFAAQFTLSVVISVLAIYFVFRNRDFSILLDGLFSADQRVVILSSSVALATIFCKTWRWKLIYSSSPRRVPFFALFRSLTIGQLANLLIPLRIGDLLRAYTAARQTQSRIARVITTIIIEKALDLVAFFSLIILLTATFAAPTELFNDAASFFPLLLLLIALLWFLASRSRFLIRIVQPSIRHQEPSRASIISRLLRMSREQLSVGLDGLESVQDKKVVILLLMVTFVIMALSIATPALLFRAFDLPLGLLEATALNVVVSLGSIPPSTPGKVLVFETLTALTLNQFGVDQTGKVISFAVVYHVVVAMPLILSGSLSLFLQGQKPATQR